MLLGEKFHPVIFCPRLSREPQKGPASPRKKNKKGSFFLKAPKKTQKNTKIRTFGGVFFGHFFPQYIRPKSGQNSTRKCRNLKRHFFKKRFTRQRSEPKVAKNAGISRRIPAKTAFLAILEPYRPKRQNCQNVPFWLRAVSVNLVFDHFWSFLSLMAIRPKKRPKKDPIIHHF